VDWLKTLHEESRNSDLVAHFFRRAFNLIRRDGCFGLIATNTIAQGDTRHTGLRWICTHGGTIYTARKRYKWPGEAAVVVSVVHARKGTFTRERLLEEKSVDRISAFLFHTGGDEDPAVLRENANRSFMGTFVLGAGFLFDDKDSDANTIPEMKQLIESDSRNAQRIFPYIGGQEINESPTHQHHRFVINFGELSLDEARAWPQLLSIVERKVKPYRLRQNREIRARYWWRFGETTPAINKAIRDLPRVLVISQVGQHCAFTFLPNGMVYALTLVVFALPENSAFACLQSRVHEIWARFLGSSMKDDLRYTPSDCFETFPFPPGWENGEALEKTGVEYYDFRAALMVRNNEGLTKTYNRFHDRYETSPDFDRLQELHDKMDRAVLDAYGWSDIQPRCEFVPTYEVEDGEATTGKPHRYRWPDEVRDEVLARLLALNAQRAEEERLAGTAADGRGKSKGPARRTKRVAAAQASFQVAKSEE
jgi:hypothetical protein